MKTYNGIITINDEGSRDEYGSSDLHGVIAHLTQENTHKYHNLIHSFY